jgi:hypothetical protein
MRSIWEQCAPLSLWHKPFVQAHSIITSNLLSHAACATRRLVQETTKGSSLSVASTSTYCATPCSTSQVHQLPLFTTPLGDGFCRFATSLIHVPCTTHMMNQQVARNWSNLIHCACTAHTAAVGPTHCTPSQGAPTRGFLAGSLAGQCARRDYVHNLCRSLCPIQITASAPLGKLTAARQDQGSP